MDKTNGAGIPAPSAGILILTGGKSRRMGRDKASLPLGETDFLGILCRRFEHWPQRLLSVGSQEPEDCRGFVPVRDRFPDCGPLGGIYTGLTVCRFRLLAAVGCDMPFYPAELAAYLLGFWQEGDQACVLRDRTGRVHPLGGVYAREAAPVLERQLRAGNYRLGAALKELAVRVVPLEGTPWEDRVLANINTPREYAAFCGESSDEKDNGLCGSQRHASFADGSGGDGGGAAGGSRGPGAGL